MKKMIGRRGVHILTLTVSYIITLTLIFCGLYSLIKPDAEKKPTDTTQKPHENFGDIHLLSSTDSVMKCVWIATVSNINYPSRPGLSSHELAAEIDSILENVARLKANTVFFQVRPCGDALYNSGFFPYSAYVSGERGVAADRGFDSLEYMVQKAHSMGISVHAWVNPVRVLTGTADVAVRDLLCDDEYAKIHPEWTVGYADGALYYDLGLPEVRNLIARGVGELVSDYDIDGVVFDDYFYPYPVQNADGTPAAFDDSLTYSKYGGSSSLGDFRRESVRTLVRVCSIAVKKADPDCMFGISPFGIWKNAPFEGGAGTGGLESYYDIYCDSLSFAREGWVDYIAPQLYWGINDSKGDFITLADWWSEKLSATSALFIPCLAPYRYSQGVYSEGEITRQAEYVRTLRGCSGIALYGYASLTDPSLSVGAEVQKIFS